MDQEHDDDDLIFLWLLFDLNFGDNDVTTLDRKWTVVPVDVTAFQTMGDPSFQLHFRLTRVTFEALLQVVGTHMVEKKLIQRRRCPVDLMLMKTLWILATPDSFRSVAVTFGTFPSTVHRHYVKVLSALCDLAPKFIKWPEADERRIIQNAFRTYSGFPGVVGCVDGTLVTVSAPLTQPRRYVDRHHQYSINVQAVCDHELVVRDLYVGEAGSMNDGRVFRRSPLSKVLLTNPNSLEANQHLIGDSAYQLTDKLLTPIRNNGHLREIEKRYNYLLCKCRARIEHCFGKLFCQWRRLKYLQTFDFEYAVETIVASFVLQNFMILNGQALDEVDDEDEEDTVQADTVFDQMIEGDFDTLPEDFLIRHPLVRLLMDARNAGAQKQQQLMAHLQER